MPQMKPEVWAAFMAGLAAPVGLYAAPGQYLNGASLPTVSQSFSAVGYYLTQAMGQHANEQPAISSETPRRKG